MIILSFIIIKCCLSGVGAYSIMVCIIFNSESTLFLSLIFLYYIFRYTLLYISLLFQYFQVFEYALFEVLGKMGTYNLFGENHLGRNVECYRAMT